MMFSSAKVDVLLKWPLRRMVSLPPDSNAQGKCLKLLSPELSRLSLLTLFWLTVDNVSGYGLMWYFCLFVLILIGSVLQTKGVVMRLLKSGLFSK